MEKNKIELKFNDELTGLAGNPFGQTIYQKQIAPYFKPEQINVIVFPDHIEDVAISFIQGLFKDIYNQYGYDKLKNIIEIKAKDSFLEHKIWENIY